MEPIDPMNVMLTPRDLDILQSLYANCVMTLTQITERHFALTAKPTAINRLTKLVAAGFIRRERIPRMELGRDKNAVGVVFQITRSGILELRRRHFGKEFRPQPISYHPYTLHHDLILVDLASRLRERFANAVVTNGKLIQGNGQSSNVVEPDLIVALPGSLAKIAIELELSDKSEKRYREIVMRYRLAKEYAAVIYFIDDPFIQSVLTRVILNRNPHPQETANTAKFYFSRASDFLNCPMATPVTNGVADIREKGGQI
jgi:DNA-binding Lrp family transcriptional regulator